MYRNMKEKYIGVQKKYKNVINENNNNKCS